jgi:pilus assembly protein CpaB
LLRRRNLVIGAAVATLAGAASLGYSTFVERSLAARESRETVVVVRRKLGAQQRLEPALLKLAQVPADCVLPGAYRSLAEAAGRVTKVTLWPGDQVIAGRTAGADEPEGLRARLVPGERGFTVPVEAETAGAVHPGDVVDVVAVTPSPDGFSQESRLVPGVRVLKVGRSGEASGSLEPWAMLAVSPVQAQTLALAAETGRLRLMLRGAADQTVASKEPVSLRPAAGSRLAAGPPSRKATVRPVEVIRGVEREPEGE